MAIGRLLSLYDITASLGIVYEKLHGGVKPCNSIIPSGPEGHVLGAGGP